MPPRIVLRIVISRSAPRHWRIGESENRANHAVSSSIPWKQVFSLGEVAWRHICVSCRRNIVEKLDGSNIT